jgi:hypothetical protein
MLSKTDVLLHLTRAIQDTLSTLHNSVKSRGQSDLSGKIRQAKRGIDDSDLMQARIWIWDYIFKNCNIEALKKALVVFFPTHFSLSYNIY